MTSVRAACFAAALLASLSLVLACGGAQKRTDEEPTAVKDGHGHGHGHAHDSHRPIEDTEAYIERLESPERDAWQKPDDVVSGLGLRGDETVVDVGAGSGYFAVRLAEALPGGRVVATDVDAEMVAFLRDRAARAGLANLQVHHVTPDDQGIPKDADVVLIVNVLHHLAGWPQWMADLHASLDGPARLVVVEFAPEPTPMGPPLDIRIRPAALIEAGVEGGWRSAGVDEALLPYQYIATFTKE